MPQPPIIITGGRLVDPASNIDREADILLEDGLVKETGSPGTFSQLEEARVIKALGLWILPGLVDMHVHLREPGQEYKEDLASGLTAAASGGFTGVLAMPNTSPPVDNAETVRALTAKAKEIPGARLWQSAAMTRGREGQELCEYEDLRLAGAVAVTDDGAWVQSGAVMRRVLDYAHVCGLLPLSHAQEQSLSKGGLMNEGRISTRLGLAGIPAEAEDIAVYRDLALARLTGKPLHICHVSTKRSLSLIKAAKSEGILVSCETAPHYLFLTHEDIIGYRTEAKMNPPLRSEEDREALRDGLADGTIDAIATDHAPHSTLEKEIEFCDAAFGIIGLETALPLMLELWRELGLPLSRLAALMSYNPCRLLNLPGGSLSKGSPADLTIIDPLLEWVYLAQEGLSKSANTPFDGRNFKGRSVMTIVGGKTRRDIRQGCQKE